MQPNQLSALGGGGGGVTNAMGSPLRVISIDFPVFFTLPSNRRQVALNFDIGIVSSILDLLLTSVELDITMVNDHGQLDSNHLSVSFELYG
jgi:hypothetical protein